MHRALRRDAALLRRRGLVHKEFRLSSPRRGARLPPRRRGRIGGGFIELLHGRDPASEASGITHIAFLTDNLDADYARLTGLGYEGLVAPKKAGTGAGRIAFFADPNGARVELIERDLPMNSETAADGRTRVRGFGHYCLRAGGMDAALGLYRDVMGMEAEEETAAGVRLRLGSGWLELLREGAGPGKPLFDHFTLKADEDGVLHDPDGVKIILEKI